MGRKTSKSKKSIHSAEEMNFGVVVSEWNHIVTDALKKACIDFLTKQGAKKENIQTISVPGSFELPMGAKLLINKHNPDAVICLGCLIKGETKHDEYISSAVASGIMHINLVWGKPVIFGVLTTNNLEQAKDRSGGNMGNKGTEAAEAAIQMVALQKGLKESEKKIGF